ncbi:MAG: hypothetical protein WD595_04180 [Waddliaceae bacterium]
MSNEEEHYFYGKPVYRDREQEYIESILKKYRNEPVTEELKKMIWDELQKEKNEGRITIPFRVVIRKDPSGRLPSYVEVLLNTKV